MATTEKLSVTLDLEDLQWARRQAKERKMSLSALLSQCVRETRQNQARQEYLEWAFGDKPITAAEIEETERELKAALNAAAAPTVSPPVRRKRASGE